MDQYSNLFIIYFYVKKIEYSLEEEGKPSAKEDQSTPTKTNHLENHH
jgi:hypothetical protein